MQVKGMKNTANTLYSNSESERNLSSYRSYSSSSRSTNRFMKTQYHKRYEDDEDEIDVFFRKTTKVKRRKDMSVPPKKRSKKKNHFYDPSVIKIKLETLHDKTIWEKFKAIERIDSYRSTISKKSKLLNSNGDLVDIKKKQQQAKSYEKQLERNLFDSHLPYEQIMKNLKAERMRQKILDEVRRQKEEDEKKRLAAIEAAKQKVIQDKLNRAEDLKQDKIDNQYLDFIRNNNETRLFLYLKKFQLRETAFQAGFVMACELGHQKIVQKFVNIQLKWSLRKKKEKKYNYPQIFEKLSLPCIIKGYYHANLQEQTEICQYLLKMINKSRLMKALLVKAKIIKTVNGIINEEKLKIYHRKRKNNLKLIERDHPSANIQMVMHGMTRIIKKQREVKKKRQFQQSEKDLSVSQFLKKKITKTVDSDYQHETEIFYDSCSLGNLKKIKRLLRHHKFSQYDIQAGYYIACKMNMLIIVKYYVEIYLHGEIQQKDEYIENHPQIIKHMDEFVLKQGYFYACQEANVDLIGYFVDQVQQQETWRFKCFLSYPSDISGGLQEAIEFKNQPVINFLISKSTGATWIEQFNLIKHFDQHGQIYQAIKWIKVLVLDHFVELTEFLFQNNLKMSIDYIWQHYGFTLDQVAGFLTRHSQRRTSFDYWDFIQNMSSKGFVITPKNTRQFFHNLLQQKKVGFFEDYIGLFSKEFYCLMPRWEDYQKIHGYHKMIKRQISDIPLMKEILFKFLYSSLYHEVHDQEKEFYESILQIFNFLFRVPMRGKFIKEMVHFISKHRKSTMSGTTEQRQVLKILRSAKWYQDKLWHWVIMRNDMQKYGYSDEQIKQIHRFL